MLCLSGLSATAQAPADVRVALVIGNSAYSNFTPLANPANDAVAMSAALRRLGFSVTELRDASQAQMAQAIERVRDSLRGKQAVGLLYYAGHGLQLDWKNYMVPVDARMRSAGDVPRVAIDVGGVVDAFRKAGTRMNILVLDACRDNPFAESAAKGLAPMDAPPGTFLAYATAPGNVAEDGAQGSNGLYTGYLVQELTRPTARIEDIFKRVRLSVRKASDGRQIPWESTSLEEDFVFNDGRRFTFRMEDLQAIAAEAKRQQEALRRAAEEALERERQLARQIEEEKARQAEAARKAEAERLAAIERERELERRAAAEREREKQEAIRREQEQLAAQAREREAARVKAEAEARERERLLAQQREEERQRAEASARAAEQARLADEQRRRQIEAERAEAEDLARRKLSEEQAREEAFARQRAEWERIQGTTNPEEIYAFLQRYPSGFVSELAQFRLDQISKVRITPSADKSGVVALGNSQARFVVGMTAVYARTDMFGKKSPDARMVVTSIADGKVMINNGRIVLDEMGNLITNADGTRSPAKIRFPAELSVGRKWRTAYEFTGNTGRKSSLYYDFRITALEEIKVPAGSFKAYRVEGRAILQDGSVNHEVYWIDPATMQPVREEWSQRSVRNQINASYIRELVSLKRPS